MITLRRLRELAGLAEPGVADLLAAWAADEAGGELERLLAGCGLQHGRLPDALGAADTAAGRGVLLDCIALAGTREPCGLHLLQALCRQPDHPVARALQAAGGDLPQLERVLRGRLAAPAPLLETVLAGQQVAADGAFSQDLTRLAREGRFDPLVRQDRVMDQLYTVLLRQQGASPLLTGPAGVGKTAVACVLARELAQGAAPGKLHGVRLIELDLGLLVGGTRYRGDFEQRLGRLIRTLRDGLPAILFVDEAHLLVGAGRGEHAAMDAAGLLKPAMSAGLRLLGATTSVEYRRFIARDAALARRFTEVPVPEPDAVATAAILQHRIAPFEEHHGVRIPPPMLERTIELAAHHLAGRREPDRSIELLDSACVVAVRRGGGSVEGSDLLEAIARLAGVPAEQVHGPTPQHYGRLAQQLEQELVGQAEAIAAASGVLLARGLAPGDDGRPLASMLFSGSTGVGKTALASALARQLFGAAGAVRFDMGEYASPGTVSRLLGAPPGYIGHEREGGLLAALGERPAGLLLFDEIEKADPEVLRVLLGLLDTGRVTDAGGLAASARRYVIVLTTNAVSAADLERPALGFGLQRPAADPRELLAAHFPRELLARLDLVSVLRDLTPSDLRLILARRLRAAIDSLEQRGAIQVRLDLRRLLVRLARRLADSGAGARDVQRLIERELLQPAARALLQHRGPGELVLDEQTLYQGAGR